MQVYSDGDREVCQVLPNILPGEGDLPCILPRCRLGEGCVWERRSGRLYFVDIEGCKIYGIRLGDGTGEIWKFDAEDMVGCLVPCADGAGNLPCDCSADGAGNPPCDCSADGAGNPPRVRSADGVVAAIGHRLVRITEDGKKTEVLLELPLPDYMRFNDGKCDADGRLWVGTMAKSQEHPKAKACGSLYCIEGNRVIAEYPGYTIPNGMAWDGNRFYHIDTSRGMIEEYRMDRGNLTGRKTTVTVDPADGSPDGMTIDSEGNLWVAMWGGRKVNCYDPRTGQKLAEIPVPAKNVSCVTFGDADLKTLYITTAMDEDGQGGRLHAVRLPVAGVLPYEYGGRGK